MWLTEGNAKVKEDRISLSSAGEENYGKHGVVFSVVVISIRHAVL